MAFPFPADRDVSFILSKERDQICHRKITMAGQYVASAPIAIDLAVLHVQMDGVAGDTIPDGSEISSTGPCMMCVP